MANHSREFATRECHGTHSCHENIKVGSCPGKTPSRGLLPDTPNFPIIPCPSGQGGYKYCLLHIHRLGTTPIGGFAPDLPSYGCAGPHLTKIQFRSRCVRAGIFLKLLAKSEPLFPTRQGFSVHSLSSLPSIPWEGIFATPLCGTLLII